MRVTCEKEMGRWTIRIEGVFVADYWREVSARRVAERLSLVLTDHLSNFLMRERRSAGTVFLSSQLPKMDA